MLHELTNANVVSFIIDAHDLFTVICVAMHSYNSHRSNIRGTLNTAQYCNRAHTHTHTRCQGSVELVLGLYNSKRWIKYDTPLDQQVLQTCLYNSFFEPKDKCQLLPLQPQP